MDTYTYYSAYEDYDNFSNNETVYLNGTLGCHISYPPGSDVYLPVLYLLIFFTGFLGNIFVLVVMGRRRRHRGQLVDTFIVNLAVADLVFVVTLPLWAVSTSQKGIWNFGGLSDVLCRLSSYVIAVNRFSNIAFLSCMSVDRYLAIVKLMDSRFLRNSGCIRTTCIIVWMASVVLGIPSLVYRKADTGYCLEDDQLSLFLVLSLTSVFLAFVLPAFIILLCYGTILLHLNKHRATATATSPRTEARRRHSLKMVLSIILAFVVSWLPFNIFKSVALVSKLSDADLSCSFLQGQSNGLLLSCCLAFLNSCVNPAIYLLLDHHFRRQAHCLCLSLVGKPKSPHSCNSSALFISAMTSESHGPASVRSNHQLFDQRA